MIPSIAKKPTWSPEKKTKTHNFLTGLSVFLKVLFEKGLDMAWYGIIKKKTEAKSYPVSSAVLDEEMSHSRKSKKC